MRRYLRGLLAAALLLLATASGVARAQDVTASPSGDSEAYVEATVDLSNPYVGQQIAYIFKYYEAVDANALPGLLVGQPDYEAPEFSNFWKEGEVEQTSYQEERNGRLYNVSELRTQLFPTLAGETTIEPARLLLSDLPGLVQRQLQTLPVTINVLPVPSSAPQGYTGAVGQYSLAAQVDRTSTTLGEPIRLTLTLSGRGNIVMAPEPQLPPLANWRVVQEATAVSPLVDAQGTVGGTKSVSYLLFPNEAGPSGIPAIEYLFFDPLASGFGGALSDPVAVEVTGDPAAPAQVQSPLAAASAAEPSPDIAGKQPAQEIAQPVFPAMQTPARLVRALPDVMGQPWYWALWLLPVGAVLGAAWVRVRTRTAAQRSSLRHQQLAAHDALRALGRPAIEPASPVEQCAAAQRALTDFLGRKSGRPVDGMTRSALAAELTRRRVPAQLVERVLDFVRTGEVARFSPAAADTRLAAQMQQQVQALIRELDKVL